MIRPEKPAVPTRESAPRRFTSEPLPANLVGKKMKVVQAALKKQYGERLATEEDLKHIQANADHYKDLQDPKVWHNAFGSTVLLGGYLYVPYVYWFGGWFNRYDRWVESDSNSNVRVLLRA